MKQIFSGQQNMRFSWRTSLRNKVVLIVLVAMVGLIGSLYALSRLVLMRGFSHLEDDFVTENIGRASSALANASPTRAAAWASRLSR
jgi:sensor domain CHASE-containing protein